jgi:hypothetical protein
MALELLKPFDTPFGITINATYWRWVGLQVDLVAQQASVVLRPFASESAAFANPPKAPVGPDRQYTLSGPDLFTILPGAVVDALNSAIYAHISGKDAYFAEAVDTIEATSS